MMGWEGKKRKNWSKTAYNILLYSRFVRGLTLAYVRDYEYLFLIETVSMEGNEHKYPINPALLWEYDLEKFDWEKGKTIVVQRVIERGRKEDYEAAYRLYGGKEGFREILKEVPYFSPIDLNFVCIYYDLEKEELKCYTRKLSREAHLSP